MIELTYRDRDTTDDSEVPEWRKDLARRLSEIRRKREALGLQPDEVPSGTGTEPAPEPKPLRLAPAPAKKPRRKGQPTPISAPPSHASPPPSELHAESYPGPADHAAPAPPQVPELPLIRKMEESAASSSQGLKQQWKDREVRDLIDAIVPEQAGERADFPRPRPAGRFSPAVLTSSRTDRLVLLSRTLSGLVDLIVVCLCGSAIVLATDVLSGIEVFDARSGVHYALLLTVIYLFYSLFFLGSGSQTIGMMITDLRVIGVDAHRPRVNQLLVRCLAYIVALLGAGLGLIWGFFDGETACLQDRLSRTRIVRIESHPQA